MKYNYFYFLLKWMNAYLLLQIYQNVFEAGVVKRILLAAATLALVDLVIEEYEGSK